MTNPELFKTYLNLKPEQREALRQCYLLPQYNISVLEPNLQDFDEKDVQELIELGLVIKQDGFYYIHPNIYNKYMKHPAVVGGPYKFRIHSTVDEYKAERAL